MAGALLPLALLLGFVSVVILGHTGAEYIFARGEKRQRINRRLTLSDAGLTREEVYTRLLRVAPGSHSGVLLAGLERRVRRLLQQAGIVTPLRRLCLYASLAAAALWVGALLFGARSHGFPALGSAMASMAGAVVLTLAGFWIWIGRRRRARLKQIETQLPIALDVMTRALQAGHPVISALQLAAEEMGDPLGSEFGLVLDETTYGAELKEALAHFGERSGSADAHFLAVAISVQAETGGNLAEILNSLAAVIRGRLGLAQKVKALSSEGRTSALFLTVLPILVVAGEILLHPSVYSSKFSDPMFWPTVGWTTLNYLIGWWIVQRIVNFKY